MTELRMKLRRMGDFECLTQAIVFSSEDFRLNRTKLYIMKIILFEDSVLLLAVHIWISTLV